MKLPAPRVELRRAFLVLFSHDPDRAAELSDEDYQQTLRRSYRRAVCACHPDRARVLGAAPEELSRRLLQLNAAHELLRQLPDWSAALLALGVPPAQRRPPPSRRRAPARVWTEPAAWTTAPGPDVSGSRAQHQGNFAATASPPGRRRAATPARRTGRSASAAPAGASSASAAPAGATPGQPHAEVRRRESSLPRKPLRFAEYLYYAGYISHRTLVEAVVWQRMKRPRIGQLAVELGLVRPEHIQQLVAQRIRDGESNVPLAEFAWQRGVITRTQAAALVARQRRLQPTIGRFFVEAGLLDEAAVESVVRLQRAHASRVAA